MRNQLFVLALALGAAACPSTQRADDPPPEPEDEPLLIATGGPFELHVRGGRVIQLVPAPSGQPPIIKEIRSLDELRTLYEASRGEPLPTPGPSGGVVLNGWAGLECVRAGHACGTAPEANPAAMVVIHFE